MSSVMYDMCAARLFDAKANEAEASEASEAPYAQLEPWLWINYWFRNSIRN